MALAELVWLVLLAPLLGVVVLAAGGRRLGEPRAGWLGTAAVGASFVASLLVLAGLLSLDSHHRAVEVSLFSWVPAGNLAVDAAFLVDPLSVTMILFVTGVSALIHLYSIGYMHGDENYSRFFLYLNLFVFSMLMLVLGNNMLVTFLGWEGVGACSYLLISFWFGDEANAVAGKKAFITNRVGDFGFLLAMFFAFGAYGTLDYAGILSGHAAQSTATAILLCLMLGAAGKSAQFPLYVWLPDAMAGPTPVSALIHAATMVTSGVYLLVRFNPLFEQASPWVSEIVAAVGLATAAVAATIALAAKDIKKVLAYSTISQLGFMFAAVGVGAWTAAIFHMVTHAFFKALLFLGAGSVIHGMAGEQDIRRYGGLARAMPYTATTFAVGTFAIAGVPPLAGFWSKDEILAHTWGANKLLWALLLLAAVLTAFYMTRLLILTFGGSPRWPDGVTPHESPLLMRLPLLALAGLAATAGVLNLPFTHDTEFLGQWLEPVFAGAHAEALGYAGGTKWVLGGIAIVAAAGGIWAAVSVYARRRVPAEKVERRLFAEAWGFDEAIGAFMGGPGRRAFDAAARFDAAVVDGAVNRVGSAVRRTGERLRATQSGLVRRYALGVAAGAVVLLAYFASRVWL
ncbi:MAG: NADH-quinone oxidoreductase subunit L [bacterium]|nr:NADH-quinone oxidoreductase subunit L [bacterium]